MTMTLTIYHAFSWVLVALLLVSGPQLRPALAESLERERFTDESVGGSSLEVEEIDVFVLGESPITRSSFAVAPTLVSDVFQGSMTIVFDTSGSPSRLEAGRYAIVFSIADYSHGDEQEFGSWARAAPDVFGAVRFSVWAMSISPPTPRGLDEYRSLWHVGIGEERYRPAPRRPLMGVLQDLLAGAPGARGILGFDSPTTDGAEGPSSPMSAISAWRAAVLASREMRTATSLPLTVAPWDAVGCLGSGGREPCTASAVRARDGCIDFGQTSTQLRC